MVRSKQSLEAAYQRHTPRSYEQWRRSNAVMPAGVIKGAYWSPPYPIYVDRAEGCYLWDLNANKYVDFANHHTAMVLGHNHPSVVKAIGDALQNGLAFGAPSTLEAEIAYEITERVPSIEKIRFTNSGTEASIHATRLIRAWTGRSKIAKFEGAYHGSHDALEVSVAPRLQEAGPIDEPRSIPAWPGMSNESEDVLILPYNQPETVELLLRAHKDELAGVFYDAKAGFYDLPHDFARYVREITQDLGLLMVMDEVISFRVGFGGFQGVCGIGPDLTILGKIIGGGMPVGALGGRADLMDLFDNSGQTFVMNQSGTFSGNTLTLAAGLANLRALSPTIYDHLDRLGALAQLGVEEAFRGAQIPCQVVREGSILSLYLTDRPVTDYRSAAMSDKDLAFRIGLALLLEGYYVRGGLLLTLSAPMQESHVYGFIRTLEKVLAASDD